MIRKICPEDTIIWIGVLVWVRKNCGIDCKYPDAPKPRFHEASSDFDY